MCIKRIKKYFSDLDKKEKIQSKQMKKSIENTKDISDAYLHGGKAVGEIIKEKKKK